jgi:hypothetical protein
MLAMLALALPKLAMAQAVAPADLVGSWALQGSKELGFTFRADSTMNAAIQMPPGKAVLTGRWHLAGDTLVVNGVAAKVNGRPFRMNVARRTIALQKKQLTLTRVDNNQSGVYEKVDSLISSSPDSSAAAPPKP